jgi:ABC-type antimicrobial peptide transport system permease subunit
VRVLTALMAGFAAFALLVAGLGLFGVLSWAVGRRRQELSIRMALGAARGQVTWMVVRQALTLAAMGSVLGAAGAGALGRGMSRFLFGVTPFDAVTLAVSLSVAFAVALVASLVPARRASRANLVEGLRNE